MIKEGLIMLKLVNKCFWLVIVLFYFRGIAQFKEVKESLQDYNLYGNVKNMTEFSYNARGKRNALRKGVVVELSLFEGNTSISFNEKGLKVKELIYNKKKETIQESIYKYDSKDRRVEVAYQDEFVIKYEYNRYGKISKEIWCEVGDCSPQYVYTYLLGRLIEKADKGKRVAFDKIMYSYAQKFGKPIKETAILADRKLEWYQEYGYDKAGRLIKKVKYNTEKIVEEERTYRYDVSGKILEKISYYRVFSPCFYGTVYTYDTKNNVVKEVHYQLDSKKKLMNEEGFWREYKYSYDANGNWVKCAVIQNGKAKYLIERNIQYY